MTLQLAIMHTAEDNQFTLQPLTGGGPVEARRSGPLTNRGLFPRPGQLVAIDTSIVPPEIAHLYDHPNPAALTEAEQAALARATFPEIIARHTPPEQPADPDADSRYMSWTGLAAAVWDPSGGDDVSRPDHDYLKAAIVRNGGPALDIGCGTGRLLLPYRAAGLDVDGVDPSAEMLALCRAKAEAHGLAVDLELCPHNP